MVFVVGSTSFQKKFSDFYILAHFCRVLFSFYSIIIVSGFLFDFKKAKLNFLGVFSVENIV